MSFRIFFLLFLLWFLLPLPGCTLLGPPTLSEVEKAILQKSGGVQLITIRPRINWFDNTWSATFIIRCPDKTKLRFFASAGQTLSGKIVVKGQEACCQPEQGEKLAPILLETKIKEEAL